VIAFWGIALPLLAVTLYALDQLMMARSPFRWIAAIAAVCLAAGCLVFLGMLSSDIVWVRQA
jgi:hypothetical protein